MDRELIAKELVRFAKALMADEGLSHKEMKAKVSSMKAKGYKLVSNTLERGRHTIILRHPDKKSNYLFEANYMAKEGGIIPLEDRVYKEIKDNK